MDEHHLILVDNIAFSVRTKRILCDMGAKTLDDLTALKKAWGKTTADTLGKGVGEYNCCADFNKIGISKDVVNLDDLTALKIGWGGSHPGSTSNVTCPAGH